MFDATIDTYVSELCTLSSKLLNILPPPSHAQAVDVTWDSPHPSKQAGIIAHPYRFRPCFSPSSCDHLHSPFHATDLVHRHINRPLGSCAWNLASVDEAVDPDAVVELSVVCLDLCKIIGKDEMVDTSNLDLSQSSSAPSPCDFRASVRNEKRLHDKLGLSALAGVKGISSIESH